MMRSLKLALSLGTVLALSIAWASPAAAASARYGPFPSGSTDSGTCGNDWAVDTFDRTFTASATPNADGTYTVREDFTRGSFVTLIGPSPQACDANRPTGGIVGPGITGRMAGFFTIIVSGGTYNSAATCTAANCGTTATFVATVYGASATYDIPTFFFAYVTPCNGWWINASANLGGNRGDISGVLHPCGGGDRD
jgi:hypothetical protein